MWSSGTVHETCSCGATVSAPDTRDGRYHVQEWRKNHRHDKPRPELKSLKSLKSLGDTSRVHKSGAAS